MASTPEQPPQITDPEIVSNNRLVTNTYLGPDGTVDRDSNDQFSEYLVERMYGKEDEVTQTYVPGEEVVVERSFKDWLISPRKAIIGTIAGFALINVALNAKNLATASRNAVRDVAHEIDPKTKKLPPTTRQLPPKTETLRFGFDQSGNEQQVGQAERDAKTVNNIARKLKATLKNGKIVSITVKGEASDEWVSKGEKSIGRPDSENASLAEQRAIVIAPELEGALSKKGLKIPEIKTKSSEKVIDDENLADLLLQIQKSKYGSILEVINEVKNNPSDVPEDLRNSIKLNFNQWRNAIVEIRIKEERNTSGVIPVPGRTVEVPPQKDPMGPWAILPFFVPPIWRRRTEPYDVFERPPYIIEEPLDKVWVELYDDAYKSNGELVEDAWALSRKYQYLYREERITQAIRYDYEDDQGQARSIDVLFVDRPELDQDTIEAINGLMFDISLMQQGTVAESLDTIVILPSEHTGPQRPDKIGLGIDDQYHENVQGVAIPVLGLVEIQLPKSPKREDIERFNGLRWVFAHEVAGHFTDVDKTVARKLVRADSNRPGKTYESYAPWDDAGADSFASAARGIQVAQFVIPHPEGINTEYVVNPGSQELKQAVEARLRGEAPTQYAGTNVEEIHAEVAAHVTTGILIPPKEARILPDHLGNKKGYKVDAGMEHRFALRIGSNTNANGLQWPKERVEERQKTFFPTLMVGRVEINSDKDQNIASETAKNTPYQPEEQRIKILARVRQ